MSDDRITFSATRLRSYGAVGLNMFGAEDQRGCPRRFKAEYVDRSVPHQRISYPLVYGGMIHRALDLMERGDMGPDEALMAAWSPSLPMEAFHEAVEDLNRYLERGGPMTRYGTIDTEVHMEALLYVDEEFGEVWYQGYVDWLGIDLEEPSLLHAVDYKSNRGAPSADALDGDVQMKGYDWLIRQNWSRWMTTERPRVMVHLDVIKFRDVSTVYWDRTIEEWAAWAEASIRKILRDDKYAPVLNPGCNWCPVRDTCPTILDLPQVGKTLAEREFGDDAESMWAWRQEAALAIKALDARVKDVDAALAQATREAGRMEFGGQSWTIGQDWKNEVDMQRLQQVLTPAEFLSVASTSKTALEKFARGMDASRRAEILACVNRFPSGEKIVKGKVDG